MLIRRGPFNLVAELNKILGDRVQYSAQEDDSAVESGHWVPAVDIKEESDKFLLHVDVPGVTPENIDVNMDNNVLTIKGERNDITKENENGYHRIERMRGSFYRRFTLPDSADAEQIHAKIKHGVLEITVGKKKTNEPRKIKIDLDK